MTYLSVEQLSKSFGLKPLFHNLTFGLSKGDKTALVAPNGTGKSTLLRVLSGKEVPDEGQVTVRNGIRTGFLEQEPQLDEKLTIREFISRDNSDIVSVIRRYEEAVQAQAENYNTKTHEAFEKALADMHAAGAWDYEQRMQQILGKLDIHELDQPIATLSGGERKRVALAFVLLDNPDLLLLDEPTNHLDVDMIEWLEDYLAKSTTTLLMVTHDRYFLDRVCNNIIEIDAGKLYHHRGNYAWYLEKKAERQEIENVEIGKANQLLKKELEWMRRSPKARTSKSKSRIDAFHETEKRAGQTTDTPQLQFKTDMKRMGKKIVELSGVNKRFDDTVILDNFSYAFQKGERIGIIGKNGSGKSTFLNILTGETPPDSGKIDKGETIVYGHYRQSGITLDDDKRVIEVVKDIAEVIPLADGSRITASQFLEHFMFPTKMQYTPVGKLSGGERRRLGLMMVLMKNPNFLILDEPTNDLDLDTLNRLEDFLQGFGGCLIIVSHDRFFMDKLVQHYFIFEGDGKIWDFNGSYREYRALLSEREAKERAAATAKKKNASYNSKERSETGAEIGAKSGRRPGTKSETDTGNGKSGKKKLGFKERKEHQRLENEIEDLEKEKADLEKQLSAGDLPYDKLQKASKRYGDLEKIIDEKTIRWLELAEYS